MHSALFFIQAQDSTLEGTPENLVPLYRYWNPELTNHFYTTRPRIHVGTIVPGEVVDGYQCGGIECFIYRNNPNPLDMQVRPLNCYFCAELQDHYYTTKNDEIIRMNDMDYVQEYPVGYCPADNNVDGYTVVTLHEYWNPDTQDHFYTINQGDLGGQRQEPPGYIYQRRVCNVLVST